MMITPRRSISTILKGIEVRFPDIEDPKERPEYELHINGVLEQLAERIALAERDISIPAAIGHKGRSFILEEINARILLNIKDSVKLYESEYCQYRGDMLFQWMLNNIPHGIWKAFAKSFEAHQELIKSEEVNELEHNIKQGDSDG